MTAPRTEKLSNDKEIAEIRGLPDTLRESAHHFYSQRRGVILKAADALATLLQAITSAHREIERLKEREITLQMETRRLKAELDSYLAKAGVLPARPGSSNNARAIGDESVG
jgi:predicted transcriptional regulator